MIDIEFKIGGRRVKPNQIADTLERAMFEQVENEIRRKLKDVRDPDTGARPKITVKGQSLDNLSFEVSGSESLVEEVKKLFG